MMKKVEIVFPKSFLNDLTEILSQHSLPGYTILEVHSSYGSEHGSTLQLGFSSSQMNLYLFSICEAAKADALIAAVSEPLKDIGGLILSSDIKLH